MEEINEVLGGIILPISMALVGLYFLFKLKFFFILKPFSLLKGILSSREGIPSLCVALAGTLGIGNIVGVASAIYFGGYGSIFWMWVSAFLAMGLKYAEVYLGMKYRRKNKNGYYGGAAYYIYEGVKERNSGGVAFVFGSFFALFCVLNSLTTGNFVQMNAVSSLLPISKLSFGILFALFAIAVVFGGIKRISKVSSYLIPILSAFYIFLCFFVILPHLKGIPNAFINIFKSAFSFRPTISGALGYTIKEAIRYGTCRGLLSNEAGCGTSPSAHASSKNESAYSQACLGVFEVFFDTLVLCTLTALAIMVSPQKSAHSPLSLILDTFGYSLGLFGRYGVIICCVLFAFATVCTQYFYGVEALGFITKSKITRFLFFVLFFSVTVFSSLIPMALMWQISDLFLSIMTLFNLIFLIYLRKKVAI